MQLSVGKDISTILPPRRGHGPVVVVAGSQIEQIFPVGDEVIVTNNN
jgi:hypothetical protein